MECEGDLAKAGRRFALRALLVVAAAGMGGWLVCAQDTAQAQDKDNCLAAPAGKATPGSHWHYRTDAAKQTKCWYLKPDGEAAQSAAAADNADAAGGPPRPAAAPKVAADPNNPAAHSHKPHQATHAAKPPAGAAPNPAASPTAMPAGQAPVGQNAGGWPDPPPQAAASPPPPQAAQSGGAWPDPPQQQNAAANAPWPDPPSTGAPGDPGTTSATSDAAPAQDTGTSNANPNSATDAPADTPQPTAAGVGNLSGRGMMALVVAIAFVAGGVLMRWFLMRLFARRRKAAAERREPLWQTDDYVMPDALARGGNPMAGAIDPERLDAEAKLALRQLLRTLERNAA